MKKFISLILIWIFFSPVISLAGEVYLTNAEAVVLALRENRDILLKTADLERAKLKIDEARADIFPTLNFTGGWSYTAGYYTKDISQTSGQFSLKQDLYKGGRIINNLKYNGYKFEVTQALLDKIKLETIYNVSKAYYALLLSAEYVKLNQEMLANSQAHLTYINERYKNGEFSQSEVLKSQAALAAVQQAFDASQMQLATLQLTLNNLLYLDKDVKIIPQDEFKFVPKEVAFDQGFLKAIQARPEIRQLESQVKADKSAIEVAKADGRPTIYASWDYYSRSHAVVSTLNTKNWNDYSVLGLTFSWPIFDGWLTKAKVEQAIVDLKQTQLSQGKLVQDIALEVKSAYLGFKNALEQLKATDADLLLYQDNLATALEKYKQGEISFLDQDDAKIKFAVSTFNQHQGIYDYIIAKFNFEKVTGGFYEV